jgi:uncharacterized membrane protein YgaE (UPF0421/DUF939 family)
MNSGSTILQLSLAFLIALVIGSLLLAAPGGRASYFAVVAGVCILLALHRSRAIRIWAVITSMIALGLVIWDHEAGVRFQQAVHNAVMKFEESQRDKAVKQPGDSN